MNKLKPYLPQLKQNFWHILYLAAIQIWCAFTFSPYPGHWAFISSISASIIGIAALLVLFAQPHKYYTALFSYPNIEEWPPFYQKLIPLSRILLINLVFILWWYCGPYKPPRIYYIYTYCCGLLVCLLIAKAAHQQN